MSLSVGEESTDDTAEYDDFIARLQAFHTQRGTTLDSNPKVGTRQVNLLHLYNRVTELGGYDAVSDTKTNKLAWRKLGQDFHLGNTTLPTLAFTLKSAYYKNLVAYEIKNFHHKEPPPKEILEDVSAKGADVLNRTVENFVKPTSREERMADGQNASENDDQTSPRADGEDPGSASGRVTRGLRQAPPPRQLYQSDVSTSRGGRQVNGQTHSPAPAYNPFGGTNGVHATNAVPQSLATYEPKQQYPLTLRPVMTPGNNFEQFKAEQKRIRDAAIAKKVKASEMAGRGLILPGTGFTGPSIYARTLLALQSGILEEQEYALHHLVKISHERGDKYRFDSFAGLAEALTRKTLEIGALVLDVDWQITYQVDDATVGEAISDKTSGSTDIVNSITTSRKRKRADQLEPELFNRRLTLINEAGLVMRNMVMLQENAQYLAKLPTIRTLLVILLNLPHRTTTTEIQQYGLEIAEQLTGYLIPKDNDQLFASLLAFVESNDRGSILSALRSICRFGLYHQQSISLVEVPMRILQRVCAWMVVEDEDLRGASLDFLYQYTSIPENVDTLLQHAEVDNLIKQLVRLLLHGARVEQHKEGPRATSKIEETPQDVAIPRISQDHVEMLLGYDEPDRSTQWLRACFEEDPTGEITQIALWQAYQLPFTPYASQRPLLPAKDFITNVSTTFSKASAQVIQGPQPKFVIKGIKARKVPVDPKGKHFMRCLWRKIEKLEEGEAPECGGFALSPRSMWEHIVTTHLGLTKNSDGKYEFGPSDPCSCRWASCRRFEGAEPEEATPFAVGMHVKTHLPDSSERAYQRSKHNQTLDPNEPKEGVVATDAAPRKRTWQMQNTAVDDRNDAAGLPLTSVLVLRNLATQIPRTATAEAANQVTEPGMGGKLLVQRYFEPIREHLFEVMACNTSLLKYLPDLVSLIDKAG